jgi:hypothetical protein
MAIDPDKFFADLPSDPRAASYELLLRINEILRSRGTPTDADYTVVNGVIEAFYEAQTWKVPNRPNICSSTTDNADEIARKMRAGQRLQFEAFADQIMNNFKFVNKRAAKEALDAALATAAGYAILDSGEKSAIHKHIEKIRAIIEESGLDDGKKNALVERLNGLALEVDRNGTRTDRFFSFTSELGFALGRFTKNAKPAVEETKAMMKIIVGARARHDGIKLPPGDEIRLLPEPQESDGQ